jgi:hypothetical protein
VLGGGIYLIVFLIAVAAEALQVRSTNTAALLFAVAGTQLSYVPLVLGPIIDATSRGFGRVSRGWAMATICVGFLVTASAVALSLATADQWWLWAGDPRQSWTERPVVCPRSAAVETRDCPPSAMKPM